MTTKTGATKMTLATEMKPPSFAAALGGGLLQLSVVYYVWLNHTTAKELKNFDWSFYVEDAWARQVLITFICMCGIWLFSVLPMIFCGHKTSDPSIVDKLWSIQPALYSWHFHLSDPSPRTLIMSICASVWSIRLTYNFIKKGGFSGGEDYRWIEVRKWFPGWQFEVFNLVFIVFFQQTVILGFSSAAALASQNKQPIGFIDGIATVLFVVFFLGETIADQQMWDFQTEKYRRKNANEPLGRYSKGFIDTGLWSWSRHPNYFCEVSMWWTFWLFSVGATIDINESWINILQKGVFQNWALLGPIFLSLLFLPPGASLDVTEMLSSRKYVEFKDYQQRVSRFVPWWPIEKDVLKTK